MKEKKLTYFTREDKRKFNKFLITSGVVLAFNAFLIPAMIYINTPPFSFLGICASVISFGVVAENLRYNFDKIRNHVLSKKYAKKYYNEIEQKIDRVNEYVKKTQRAYDIYVNLKNNPSTPPKFLDKVRIEAYKIALEARMVTDVHEFNLNGNAQYFNNMILREKDITLGVTTIPSYFDLSQERARKYITKYKEIENKIKYDCDVRYLNLKQHNKETVTENELIENPDTIPNESKNTQNVVDKPFEQ